MKSINNIMVAVDFSDYSLAAAEYAAELAMDVGASLLLTNVYNQRDIDMMSKIAVRHPRFEVKKHIDENVSNRMQRLDELAQKLHGFNIDTETNVRIGVPYEALLQEIEEKRPDFLVMGVKGRSNLADMLIGSCAQRMYKRSPIPLLSLRRENITA
jgi:nucleotide-binding universal stress UspA family protein